MNQSKRTTSKPKLTNTHIAYFNALEVSKKMKEFAVVGNRGEIIEEVKTQFKICKKYKFNKLCAEFATYLHFYYDFLSQSTELGKIYLRKALYYNKLSYAETLSSIKFASIARKINATRKPDEETFKKLSDICKDFDELMKNDSVQIKLDGYMLKNILAAFNENPDLVLKQCDEIINYLEDNQIKRSLAIFYNQKAGAQIFKGEYGEATISINKAITQTKVGSFNWSYFVYYQVILELHQRNYKKAYEIFSIAEKKKKINTELRETWVILRGYMMFLQFAGKISGMAKIRIGKLLNDTEVFNRDKSGNNINLIILKVLLRLENGRDRIIDEQESIRHYRRAYLKGRSYIFFKLIHQIVCGGFNPEEISRRAKLYAPTLPEQKGYNPGFEVIPYNHLWELVLETLKIKKMVAY